MLEKSMGEPMTKRSDLPYLSFSSDRRFGIELELNAFDGKNRPDPGQKVAGIDYVAHVVANNSTEGTDIREWEHTHGNDVWVVKPDSSCGMEVCSPIFKGWTGLKKCCEVVAAIGDDPKIKVDQRCSVHIHVEVADLSVEEIGSVIAHWFKVEPVFMDSVPPSRKRNRYCQFMGMTNLLQHDTRLNANDLIKRVGNVKYYSLNTNQYLRGHRKTLEFRIIEGDGCKDAYLIKNWTRLIIHFIEMARKRPLPCQYVENDPFSSVCWLDPEDAFKLLGFGDNPWEYELSPGLKQTRNWFLARMQKYMAKDIESGPRHYAYKELLTMLKRNEEAGDPITPENCLTPSDLKNALFCEETKV
jgi:hypothetical protein